METQKPRFARIVVDVSVRKTPAGIETTIASHRRLLASRDRLIEQAREAHSELGEDEVAAGIDRWLASPAWPGDAP